MNKKIYLLPLLLLVALFTTSCEETKEAGKYDNWQPRNQAFLDSLQNVYDTKPDHGGLKYFVPF
ncbi:MAG: peptidylprolyl isomerase, partial [Bacteroides sp.]